MRQMTIVRLGLTTLLTAITVLSVTGAAHAWGCVSIAVDTETDQTKWQDVTYGYSFHYND
jgi:hypothetical protein